MKKFLLLGVATGMMVLSVGTVYADQASVTYSACVTSQDNIPFSNMRVRVEYTDEGYTDNNGCFTANVQSNLNSNITLSGRKSFDPVVPDSNGLGYRIDFKTGYLESNLADTVVVPITPVYINTTGVDGVSVNNVQLTIDGTGTIDTGRDNPISVRVGNDSYAMTGGNGYVRLGIPTGLTNGSYKITSDASYGYEPYESVLTASMLADSSPKVIDTTLQYPSPYAISNLNGVLDSTGHAQLTWSSSLQVGSIRVYNTSNGERQLIATLPHNATGYDAGAITSEGSYQYVVRTANQYGYEGTGYDGVTIYNDNTAPVLDGLTVTATRNENEVSMLNVKYTDYQTVVANVEYFIDNDPGLGQATSIGNYDENGYSVEEIAAYYPVGTYTIGVRAVDVNGNWTATSYRTFEITAAPSEVTVEE